MSGQLPRLVCWIRLESWRVFDVVVVVVLALMIQTKGLVGGRYGISRGSTWRGQLEFRRPANIVKRAARRKD